MSYGRHDNLARRAIASKPKYKLYQGNITPIVHKFSKENLEEVTLLSLLKQKQKVKLLNLIKSLATELHKITEDF